VELELRKLEAAVESIHHNLMYLKARQVISSFELVFTLFFFLQKQGLLL
jgi:hypothetical protein